MISIQYINIELDEERSSARENSFFQTGIYRHKRQLNAVPGFMDMVYIHSESL